jgi:hypothetical protein
MAYAIPTPHCGTFGRAVALPAEAMLRKALLYPPKRRKQPERCTTYPTQSLVKTKDLTYTVLGYVGRDFASYEEAVLAAQKKYANADAVVAITGTGTNILVQDMKFALIPWSQLLGLSAVKFEERPALSERLLRFLFGGEF